LHQGGEGRGGERRGEKRRGEGKEGRERGREGPHQLGGPRAPKHVKTALTSGCNHHQYSLRLPTEGWPG